MKSFLFLFIFHNIYQLSLCESCLHWHELGHIDIFEFGVNTGKVVFNVLGQIAATDKIVRIPIDIQPCRKLVFVHVETRNKEGPPYVYIDWDLNTVVIKYRPKQYSASCYTVIAKTLSIPQCMF